MKVRSRIPLATLFVVAIVAYAANRWGMKPRWPGNVFLQNYFNDLWMMPCAVPAWCWGCEALKIRAPFQRARSREIVALLVLWSVLFEVMGPRFLHHGVADVRDVIAYATGAFLTAAVMNLEALMKFLRARNGMREGNEQADAMLDVA
jgi:hypothetical protein